MRIAIITNVNLDFLCQIQSKKNDVFQTQGYGQWIQYALKDSEELITFAPNCIFVILDGFALLEDCKTKKEGLLEIDQNLSYIASLADRYSDADIAVSTIDIPLKQIHISDEQAFEDVWCSYWNEKLDQLSMSMNHVHRFDLGSFIHDFGRSNFYSDKMWYMGSIPYSMKGISMLSEQIDAFLEKLTITRKKVLVLDLDNTLWGGVLGEDGPKGITLSSSLLGAVYRDAQKRIKELKELGVLLAVVSKNNPDEVEALFAENAQMVLQKNDFVSIVANWQDKSTNIQQLAKQLNLGLDSFVFLDDNEVERESVKRTLPMVEVVDFPKDVANLPATIIKIYKKYFWQWTITEEDQSKTKQYQAEALRNNDMAFAVSIDDYLLSLNMHIEVGEVETHQIDRVVQLIGKTNQFNTCTLRLDLHQFQAYLNHGNAVYTVNVSDKYGDSGLVAVVMVRKEGQTATIDNFLMSCRVMGRQIENAVFEAIENRFYCEGIKKIQATYVPTNKNIPVADLWDRLGYQSVSNSGESPKQYDKHLNSCQDLSPIKATWRE